MPNGPVNQLTELDVALKGKLLFRQPTPYQVQKSELDIHRSLSSQFAPFVLWYMDASAW